MPNTTQEQLDRILQQSYLEKFLHTWIAGKPLVQIGMSKKQNIILNRNWQR